VLAEELTVIDATSSLWGNAKALLEIVLRLEQNDDTYTWHGWKKKAINAFLQDLPMHCSLVFGVWDSLTSETSQGQDSTMDDALVLGCVCEVKSGEVVTIRTFEALHDEKLPPVQQLEPGYQHALALMSVIRQDVAPVAWALFTDRSTWDDWIFAGEETEIAKGEVLAEIARQGRCVLMGSKTAHPHNHHNR
jgi:hypothetical protein